MEISYYLSRKIKILSFLAIYMVVTIHTAMPQANDLKFFDFFQRFIGDFICRLYLPLFMTISGFLFYANITKTSKKIWFEKYKRRFKSLLIPYIIWNLLFVAQLAILQFNPITSSWISDGLTPFISSGSILYSTWVVLTHPANLPLWFVRDLMIIVIFTPLIYYLVKSKFNIPIILLLLIIGFKIQFAFCLAFFIIGGNLSIKKINLNCKLSNSILLVSIIISVFFGVFLTLNGPITNLNFYLAIFPLIALWFGYDYLIVKGIPFNFLTKLLPYTFFIYVFHEPSLNVFKKTIILLGNKSELSYFITYLASPVLMVLLSYFIGAICSRFFPKSFSIITGFRT